MKVLICDTAGWVGLIAHMEGMRNAYKIWLESLKERDYKEDQGIDRRIILEWILGNWVERCGLDVSGSG
jgi:hypothetical protein